MKIDCDVAKAEMLYRELGKLRCWFTGRTSAGAMSPPGEDSLWMVQRLLKDAIDKSKKESK